MLWELMTYIWETWNFLIKNHESLRPRSKDASHIKKGIFIIKT